MSSSKLFDLTGKVALITGATRGIGLAIAEEMAHAGAQVMVSSDQVEACAEVAAQLRALVDQSLAQRSWRAIWRWSGGGRMCA